MHGCLGGHSLSNATENRGQKEDWSLASYVQYFNDILATFNNLPNKLMSVVATINEPLRSLTHTLIVTNVLLGLLFLTSLVNIYMLWRYGKK
jgi:hypothetical protein